MKPSNTERTVALARALPKAELHIHIEGSLEPELIFALARRNGVSLPYATVEALRAAYAFTDLQSFLNIYYAGASVLLHEADFYDMAWAYFERAHADHVIRAELFFDPQTHTSRGVSMATVVQGLSRACADAQSRLGISAGLILCFLRHLSEADAFETLEAALPYREHFIGVGLDSSELGHPPEKFERVFARCRELGLHTVAHAGEEGPPEYMWQAIDLLQVQRIDHGVACLQDPLLVAELAHTGLPLTVCPLSNLKLCVVPELRQHPLKKMLDAGLCVTVNSDDPAYFGGYLNENFEQLVRALDLGDADVITLARNSLQASFVSVTERARLLAELDRSVLALASTAP
jgi:adenine deaminase